MPEPTAGTALSTKTFTVSQPIVDDFYRGLEMEAKPGDPVPSTVASEPDNSYFNEIAFSNHVGHLWMRQGWECIQPLQLGTTYTVEGEIRDVYQRRNRDVVHYETRLIDPAGTLVLKTQHHQSFLSERPAGEVEFRDPTKKPGARKFNVPDGDRFGGLTRKITVQMCGDFFHGDANYHTDKAASKELGFRDVVVGGRMTMALVGSELEARFGLAWWTSGTLDIKFTNPVWADDTVTVHGVVTGPDPQDASRTHAFVWVEKPDETIALIVEASIKV